MDDSLVCVTCAKVLVGRQRSFCSLRCKNIDTNLRHQSYDCQQARGIARKLDFMEQRGACCGMCSYDRNSAALAWHHRDPALKSFSLDLRSLSNRSQREIFAEMAKCDLLCANCHAEVHWPQFQKSNKTTAA